MGRKKEKTEVEGRESLGAKWMTKPEKRRRKKTNSRRPGEKWKGKEEIA